MSESVKDGQRLFQMLYLCNIKQKSRKLLAELMKMRVAR